MFGVYEFGVLEYGYSYSTTIAPPPLDPLPGIMGLGFFGQPLWIIPYVPIASHGTATINGSAIIVDNRALPHKHSVKITGNAVIQRKSNYLT